MRLLACGRASLNWQQQHLPRLAHLSNLGIITIDQSFLAGVVQRLERAVVWSITITEGNCYLTIGDETLETALPAIG